MDLYSGDGEGGGGRRRGAYIWDANWIAYLGGVYSGEGQLMYIP